MQGAVHRTSLMVLFEAEVGWGSGRTVLNFHLFCLEHGVSTTLAGLGNSDITTHKHWTLFPLEKI